jgi:hypothetical protein
MHCVLTDATLSRATALGMIKECMMMGKAPDEGVIQSYKDKLA